MNQFRPYSTGSRQVPPWRAAIVALQFLTTLPPWAGRMFTPQELGQAVGYFPLVGWILGGLLAGANLFLAKLFPDPIRSALVLVLWILLTGALHLDGFLDACDGLLGGWTPEKRLEIMRDERVGAYAVAGGGLLLLIKFAAIGAISTNPAPLLLAPVLARWAVSLAIVLFPYARPQGLGSEMKKQAGWLQAGLASLFALAISWLSAGWLGLGAAGCALLVLFLFAALGLRMIAGMTGDLYGATAELVELAVLLLFTIQPARWIW